MRNLIRRKHSYGDRFMTWTLGAASAFPCAKKVLTDTEFHAHPLTNAPMRLMTDASNTAVGVVIQQLLDGEWRSLQYIS